MPPLAALDWLLEQNDIGKSEYFHKLIPSRVLAIGHSHGPEGTLRRAPGWKEAVKNGAAP